MSDDALDALLPLLEATAREIGAAFFPALVRQLAAATGAAHALVAEIPPEEPRSARVVAQWSDGRADSGAELALPGTLLEAAIRDGVCHHAHGVRGAFPADALLVRLGAESALAVALLAGGGAALGVLALVDGDALPIDASRLAVLRLCATRAAAEIERRRAEDALRASEQRLRDLYEEAPIAYVYEDTESRFVSANRAAARLLGIAPEEVVGTIGLDLVAPTPENQRRVQEALGAVQQGEERASIELELRRKDDGRPVFVQWWSKPEPDGKHTRTMLVDVTARVLAERERNRLEQQNLYLQEEIKSQHDFEEIVGGSPALRATLTQIAQVAPLDSTVLILGETGTGKELLARAIHDASKRRDKPLIKLNCAAVPAGLMESELFGHEKGAFTGALGRRVGRFALADGGTIFLDEIGEIPPDMQLRLLRVLQEREFEPVGSSRTVKVDVRVIAATNRDLEAAIADGSFRADLFYRLNVFPVQVPPLRERREDVPILARYFVEKYAAKIGRAIDEVAPETLERLVAYPWPGNVRELENVIERAVILAPGRTLVVDANMLGAAAAPPAAAPARPSAPPAPDLAERAERALTLEAFQRQHILDALAASRWVVEGPRGAAAALGLPPNTLRSRMKKLGIRRGAGDAT